MEQQRRARVAGGVIGGRGAVGVVGVLAVAGALVGCSDAPTRPAASETPPALAISAERAGMIQAVLQDVRERSLEAAVERADARAELDDALALLSSWLEARDARGVERGLRGAREVLARYRATVGEQSAFLPELEAISLMLDGVEAAVAPELPSVSATHEATTKRRED